MKPAELRIATEGVSYESMSKCGRTWHFVTCFIWFSTGLFSWFIKFANEPVCFAKRRKCLDQANDCWFVKKGIQIRIGIALLTWTCVLRSMENEVYATPSVGRCNRGSCTTYICYFKVLFEELAQDTVCASLVRVKIRTLNLAYTKEKWLWRVKME
jgi:hypothetical protein